MKKNLKNTVMSIPIVDIELEKKKQFSNTNGLRKCKIIMLHDKDNPNDCSIELRAMEKAEKTVFNRPVLAHITLGKDGKPDFGGHDIEPGILEDEYGEKYITEKYLELPIGVIPESTNIEYYEKDGFTYVSVTAYIYEGYSNEAIGLISKTNGKCVSSEILVKDGNWSEEFDCYNITEFEYRGVTVLGDDIEPAMGEECRVSLEERYPTFTKKIMSAISGITEEKNKGGDEPMNFEKFKEILGEVSNETELFEKAKTLKSNKEEYAELFSKKKKELDAKNEELDKLKKTVEDLEKFKFEAMKTERESNAKKVRENFSTIKPEEYEAQENSYLEGKIGYEDFEKEVLAIFGKKEKEKMEKEKAKEDKNDAKTFSGINTIKKSKTDDKKTAFDRVFG